MQDSNPTVRAGSVTIETLFKGSKSEDRYPVFICENGDRFRIHIKGNESKDAALLSHLNGLNVRLTGRIDDIKGHARIVIDPDLSQSVEIIKQNSEEKHSASAEDLGQESENKTKNKDGT